MSAPALSGPIAAATVLYRPDAATFEPLLSALAAGATPLFVFVNGALETGVEALLARHAPAAILRSGENIGLGAGLNAVMEAAGAAGFGRVLLFDQDSSPEPGLPAALERDFAKLTAGGVNLAALGPVLAPPEGGGYRPLWYSRRGVSGLPEAVDFLPTSGSLVDIAAWRAIGPFRADFFIDGIDVEWCFRAWSRGFACALAPELRMAHRWGTADADGAGKPQILRQAPLRTYYYLRNGAAALRLGHLPLRWRLRSAARLSAQALLFAAAARPAGRALGFVARSLAEGWRGRLGPAPPGRSLPALPSGQ